MANVTCCCSASTLGAGDGDGGGGECNLVWRSVVMATSGANDMRVGRLGCGWRSSTEGRRVVDDAVGRSCDAGVLGVKGVSYDSEEMDAASSLYSSSGVEG
jgi:hypothetical protein